VRIAGEVQRTASAAPSLDNVSARPWLFADILHAYMLQCSTSSCSQSPSPSGLRHKWISAGAYNPPWPGVNPPVLQRGHPCIQASSLCSSILVCACMS
jgi:hypothetical protein